MQKTCFQCGVKFMHDYGLLMITLNNPTKLQLSNIDGFCSEECMEQDNARLVEGNGIIAAAEKNNENQPNTFSELNKLRLDTTGVMGQQLGNMIHFGRPKAQPLIDTENQDN